MKKIILVFLVAAVFVTAFSIEFERRNYDKFGFSIEIPSTWNPLTNNDTQLSFCDESTDLWLTYATYPFDSTGNEYADYSVFTDEYRSSIIENSKKSIMDERYEFDLLFTTEEFKKINEKTFLCFEYDGLLWEEYLDDYSLPEIFDEIVYIVLVNGKLHNFTLYIEETYFSEEDRNAMNHVIESIDFK